MCERVSVCVSVCVTVAVRDILALCLALRCEEVKTENGNCSSCCCCGISSQRVVVVAVVLISKLTYFRSPFVLPLVVVVLSQLLSRQAKWSLISHRRLGRRHMRGRVGACRLIPKVCKAVRNSQVAAAGVGGGGEVFSAND